MLASFLHPASLPTFYFGVVDFISGVLNILGTSAAVSAVLETSEPYHDGGLLLSAVSGMGVNTMITLHDRPIASANKVMMFVFPANIMTSTITGQSLSHKLSFPRDPQPSISSSWPSAAQKYIASQVGRFHHVLCLKFTINEHSFRQL